MLLINYETNFIIKDLYDIFYANNFKFEGILIDNYLTFATQLNEFMNDGNRYFLIARDDKIVVGYMIFKIDNETLFIDDMQIDEKYQGKRMLFRDFLFFAKSKTSTKIKFFSAFIPNYNIKAQKIAQHLKMDKTNVLTNGIMFVGKIKKI